MHRPIHAIQGPYRADVTDTWSSSLERQHHPNRLAPSRTQCSLARHAATVRRQHQWRRIRRLDNGPGRYYWFDTRERHRDWKGKRETVSVALGGSRRQKQKKKKQ